ncbi:unnamed protein product [Nezara viridula]|uniref:Uncharacterized protein n=1 Tax=Nezara viridula TaxID=85310 RepID=A0A9P0MYU8_NEZVI|nr:unnamed protein product [Nezara viridula]
MVKLLRNNLLCVSKNVCTRENHEIKWI